MLETVDKIAVFPLSFSEISPGVRALKLIDSDTLSSAGSDAMWSQSLQ